MMDFINDIEFSDDFRPKLEIKGETLKFESSGLDMEKSEQLKKDVTGTEQGMFIEGRKTKLKSVQHFMTVFLST